MWLLSNFFILLHLSAKQALGHQEANNRQYPFDKRITENLRRGREMGVIWNVNLSPVVSVLDRV